MEFDDGRTLDWEFSHALLRRPSTPNPAFLYQVGDQEVFTKIEEETENHLSLESVLDDSWSSRIGIIEWLVNAFHCEIDEIHLWDDLSYFFDLVEKWDKLESVRFLAIKECNYTYLLHTLLPVRLERRLTTYVHTLNCPEPLRIRLTRKVEFRYIHSNVTSLSLQELPAYIWRILKICLDGFEFIIPNFNTQRIQFLKNDPDLSDNIDLLREKYEICPRSKEIFKTTEPTFYLVKQDRAFVHYFLEETPGVYNRWLGHYWEPKPQPVE
ncbi:hypothetical protein CAEBREN_05907 [Caenorhabditis brenneri]|uniref:DUF38 domain-containing protein n=1 Tax=Caenorhabditis brenneri TaxID=135651 RepID=G0MA85_CAEBE|nr:hypothetical protein CAEBREN_05907 [Caenorhabditis brenneri]